MKELGKIKHIIIAISIILIAVLFGVLTVEKQKNDFVLNPEDVLEKLFVNNYISELEGDGLVLIDIRNQYEYERGHLENAKNIAAADLMIKENQGILLGFQNSSKIIALYGNNPEEANIPFVLLQQLGFENVKLLPIELSYEQNKLIIKQVDIEKQENDINSFIAESVTKAKAADAAALRAAQRAAQPKPAPKPVVLKKKKKRPPEGGC